jgi:hypothetical protein
MKDSHTKNNTNIGFTKPSSKSGQRDKDSYLNNSKFR